MFPSRRGFLQIGGLGLGGLCLPQLLRAESKAGRASSPKSVILIYLVGGPPHQDMFALKPDAPKEIAGPWKPIATNVTGIQICEAFPRIAKMMDKFTIIRSLVGNQADHDAIQVFNGRHVRTPKISYAPSTGAGNASAAAGTTQPGRDHWPRGFSNIWFGGGIAPGRFVGATDRRGEDSIERVCGPGDFLATIYHHLGIDYAKTFIHDFNGRPTAIVDRGKAIPELMG